MDYPPGVGFLTEAGERALVGAIEAVELRSRAELVVVVREQAGDYLGPELIVGNLVGLATLTFLMYSRWEFLPILFLIQPVLAVAATVAVLRAVPLLRRGCVPIRKQEEAVRRAAAACFFDKGIRNTRERTGVLVFVALFEQRVEIVADGGITAFVPKEQWREAFPNL